MSKFSLTPNYCSCTVLRARNLLDKTKNGVDPFCTIAMGKEKFATAACEKTSAPDWHEQCDMPIADDATIKLTVYHKTKNSLSKGDFIGRAYVSLRGLEDYDRVITKWYKLSDKEGKFDKDRGEIEVSLQFYSKNNTTGSVLDLATKKKHLSLRDIRQSLSDKLKTASKHRKHDQRGNEDQFSDQRSYLDGDNGSGYNVRRFPDDSASESASFIGSFTSLNSLQNPDNKQQKKNENKLINGPEQTPSSRNRILPDIVGQPAVKSSPQITVSSGPKKIENNNLSVLGYNNVKSTAIHPKVRQELDYLDREELLHVIAYQLEIIKKRDTRIKDLENYADGLLVKIVEQCPSILQSANININRKQY